MIYFAFSDETGDYQQEKSDRFLTVSPYYVRSSVLMRAEEWKRLRSRWCELRASARLPVTCELKWSNLWTINKLRRDGKSVGGDQSVAHLEGHSYRSLLTLVKDSLRLLHELSYCKVIATVTANAHVGRNSERDILKWHIQNHMQRIEMELQHDQSSLCVFFVDPVSAKKNELFRDVYNDIYNSGDFIKRYSHVKDSLNIEKSHHSVGIQLADLVVGVFCGMLRGYKLSRRVYSDLVAPIMRRGPTGNLLGYGVIEIPTARRVRETITKLLPRKRHGPLAPPDSA